MKKRVAVSLLMAVILMMALAGGAYASDSSNAGNLLALNWDGGKARVGLLEKAGIPGYDFVLIHGENRILLIPANREVALKLTANLKSRVMVRGAFVPEKFSHRRVMEVNEVRALGQKQFVDELRNQDNYDQSVSENVYNPPGQVEDPGNFADVDPGHWANKAIREMTKRKILTGMGNSKFEPNAQVTRAQFATMLVKALGLPVSEPGSQTFADVGPQEWSYKYVEAAKEYLTGYQTQAGTVLFHPHIPAVREDMAVAIVKARGLEPATDLSVLNTFSDSKNISENLKPYVAAAVNAGLMKGYENGTFRPQGRLTRAEAAALLYKVMQGEKIVM